MRKKWEYTVRLGTGTCQSVGYKGPISETEFLNCMGQYGWELCSTFQEREHSTKKYYFKREVIK